MRHKASPEVRQESNAARTEILKAANGVRAYQLDRLTRRHIQQAVRIVRHHRLVPAKVLADAGYCHDRS